LAFSPDGQMLASVLADKVQLWDVATGTRNNINNILSGHKGRILAVTFSPDGQTLASGSDNDSTIRLWDTSTGTREQTFESDTELTFERDRYDPFLVALSPNSQMLASSFKESTILLLDLATGTRKHLLGGNKNRIWQLAFSPDGQMLASTSLYEACLWDVATGIRKHTFFDRWDSIAFSPDGRMLAVNSYLPGYIIGLWNVATETWRNTYVMGFGPMTFSPDGQTLALLSGYSKIYLMDVAAGTLKYVLKGSREQHAVAFSPDGQTLASGSEDSKVRLWDTSTCARKCILKGHDGPVSAVAFSPDGQVLASASKDSTVRVWNVITGVCERTLNANAMIEKMVFSSDGRHLITDWGLLTLNLESSDISNQENPPFGIFVTKEWVTQDQQNMLWLPPDYRPTNVVVYNNKLMLWLLSRKMVELEFARF
jgi:WD40 repeat protein